MTIIVIILGVILGLVGTIVFLAISRSVIFPVIILAAYIITAIVLFQTGKKLQSFLGIYDGKK